MSEDCVSVTHLNSNMNPRDQFLSAVNFYLGSATLRAASYFPVMAPLSSTPYVVVPCSKPVTPFGPKVENEIITKKKYFDQECQTDPELFTGYDDELQPDLPPSLDAFLADVEGKVETNTLTGRALPKSLSPKDLYAHHGYLYHYVESLGKTKKQKILSIKLEDIVSQMSSATSSISSSCEIISKTMLTNEPCYDNLANNSCFYATYIGFSSIFAAHYLWGFTLGAPGAYDTLPLSFELCQACDILTKIGSIADQLLRMKEVVSFFKELDFVAISNNVVPGKGIKFVESKHKRYDNPTSNSSFKPFYKNLATTHSALFTLASLPYDDDSYYSISSPASSQDAIELHLTYVLHVLNSMEKDENNLVDQRKLIAFVHDNIKSCLYNPENPDINLRETEQLLYEVSDTFCSLLDPNIASYNRSTLEDLTTLYNPRFEIAETRVSDSALSVSSNVHEARKQILKILLSLYVYQKAQKEAQADLAKELQLRKVEAEKLAKKKKAEKKARKKAKNEQASEPTLLSLASCPDVYIKTSLPPILASKEQEVEELPVKALLTKSPQCVSLTHSPPYLSITDPTLAAGILCIHMYLSWMLDPVGLLSLGPITPRTFKNALNVLCPSMLLDEEDIKYILFAGSRNGLWTVDTPLGYSIVGACDGRFKCSSCGIHILSSPNLVPMTANQKCQHQLCARCLPKVEHESCPYCYKQWTGRFINNIGFYEDLSSYVNDIMENLANYSCTPYDEQDRSTLIWATLSQLFMPSGMINIPKYTDVYLAYNGFSLQRNYRSAPIGPLFNVGMPYDAKPTKFIYNQPPTIDNTPETAEQTPSLEIEMPDMDKPLEHDSSDSDDSFIPQYITELYSWLKSRYPDDLHDCEYFYKDIRYVCMRDLSKVHEKDRDLDHCTNTFRQLPKFYEDVVLIKAKNKEWLGMKVEQ